MLDHALYIHHAQALAQDLAAQEDVDSRFGRTLLLFAHHHHVPT